MMRQIIFVLLLSSAMWAQATATPSGALTPVPQSQASAAPPADDLAQMRNDLNQMDSLLGNMSSEIEFLHDQNLQILLRTNARMWTILIRDLRQQGFRLEAIRAMLLDTPDGAWSEYALISGLFSTTFFTVEKPQRKAISEMASHWATPATPEQKARLSQNGLYRPMGPDEVEMLSPALERIGIQLAELNVPLDTVLDLQDKLIDHSRAIAKVYVEQLFLALLKNLASSAQDQRPAGQAPDVRLAETMKSLFERLRPLAIGSVSAAFPVILQQEFDRSVQKAMKKAPR